MNKFSFWSGAIAVVLVAFSCTSSAIAQQIAPRDVWQRVYQQLPDFPRENHYLHAETERLMEDNTLAERLMRYHLYVRGRPYQYRLDWKLTLSEYIDPNVNITPDIYPGADDLAENPLEGDREAIRQLTRQQRNELVDAIVSVYNPNYPELWESSRRDLDPPDPPVEDRRDDRLPPEQPGDNDADLLLP